MTEPRWVDDLCVREHTMTVAKYRLLTFFSVCAFLILSLLWYLD
ncbi:MAG: hypothetical protein O2782_12880 [bacterium]|nr:hypothetical protein [bacterium]